jgi:hypothetical protein
MEHNESDSKPIGVMTHLFPEGDHEVFSKIWVSVILFMTSSEIALQTEQGPQNAYISLRSTDSYFTATHTDVPI